MQGNRKRKNGYMINKEALELMEKCHLKIDNFIFRCINNIQENRNSNKNIFRDYQCFALNKIPFINLLVFSNRNGIKFLVEKWSFAIYFNFNSIRNTNLNIGNYSFMLLNKKLLVMEKTVQFLIKNLPLYSLIKMRNYSYDFNFEVEMTQSNLITFENNSLLDNLYENSISKYSFNEIGDKFAKIKLEIFYLNKDSFFDIEGKILYNLRSKELNGAVNNFKNHFENDQVNEDIKNKPNFKCYSLSSSKLFTNYGDIPCNNLINQQVDDYFSLSKEKTEKEYIKGLFNNNIKQYKFLSDTEYADGQNDKVSEINFDEIYDIFSITHEAMEENEKKIQSKCNVLFKKNYKLFLQEEEENKLYISDFGNNQMNGIMCNYFKLKHSLSKNDLCFTKLNI